MKRYNTHLVLLIIVLLLFIMSCQTGKKENYIDYSIDYSINQQIDELKDKIFNLS